MDSEERFDCLEIAGMIKLKYQLENNAPISPDSPSVSSKSLPPLIIPEAIKAKLYEDFKEFTERYKAEHSHALNTRLVRHKLIPRGQ